MIKIKVSQIWEAVGPGWEPDELGLYRIISGDDYRNWKTDRGTFMPQRFRGTSLYDPRPSHGSEFRLSESSLISEILKRYEND